MINLPLRHSAGGNAYIESSVAWGAIICGAYAAAAVSLLLLVLEGELGNPAPILSIF